MRVSCRLASPRRGRRRPASALAALALAAAVASPAAGYESDQYSNRLRPLADSREELNRLVNEAILRVAERWEGPRNPWRFALKVYWRVGGLHWVDRIERWAMKSPVVDRLPQRRRDSIFRGAPLRGTRLLFLFGVSPTLKVGGVLIGADKLGHFFSQGMKYYQSHVYGEPEDEVLARGRFNEGWILGQMATGVYSNADLVANYEGYRFYRSLSEEGVVPGKGAILAWRDGRPKVARPFDWADHVNDYWDEALNPSHFGGSLQRFMDRRLRELCGDYARDPATFEPRLADELALRYAHLGLRPEPRNRLDAVCGGGSAAAAGAGPPTPWRGP